MTLFLLFLLALFVCIVFGLQQKRLGAFGRAFHQKEEELNHTSRLLIEKNAELFDQNRRLQKLLETKEDFIGIASHQLRTPLTEIKWGVESLIEKGLEVFRPPEFDRLGKIAYSANKMIKLVDDLLRLVHAEAGYGEYALEECNMEELISKVATRIRGYFSHKNIDLEYHLGFGSQPLLVDRDMMETALSNLVENAFHYTPPGGKVTISTQKMGNKFSFEIQDTGVGIPKSKQQAIFQKFQRSEVAMQMNSGGIGLGLYITKNIIEQHQGEIGFQSQEGKGSTFFFTLPVRVKK